MVFLLELSKVHFHIIIPTLQACSTRGAVHRSRQGLGLAARRMSVSEVRKTAWTQAVRKKSFIKYLCKNTFILLTRRFI